MNSLIKQSLLTGSLAIGVLQSLSAQDTLDTSQLPTSLAPQASYTVSLPYTASQQRDIVVSWWDNGAWIAGNTTTVSAGSGTHTPTVNLPGVPAEGSNYTWKAFIRPVGADWTQNIDGGDVNNVVVSGGGGGGGGEGGGGTGSGAWIESGGVVIIEAENIATSSNWVTRPTTHGAANSMGGSLGGGWLEWTGAQYSGNTKSEGGVNGILTIEVEISTPGDYFFRWRSKQYDNVSSGDAGNDTFVSLTSGTAVSGFQDFGQFHKVWVQSQQSWSWRTTFEPVHGTHYSDSNVRRYYEAGTHTIRLAARSPGHAIDRIVLHRTTIPFNTTTFENATESDRGDPLPLPPYTYDANVDFSSLNGGDVNYYNDYNNDVLGINPNAAGFDDTKFARASATFEGISDDYDVTITTMTEEDGECTYNLLLNGSIVASYQNPGDGDPDYPGDLTTHTHTWSGISINNGDTLAVSSNAHSNDTIPENNGANNFAWARGRWQKIALTSHTAPPPDSAAENTPSAGIYGETDGSGNYKKWHRVSIAFEGPNTNENATPNPFTDYRLNVTFTHPISGKTYTVPGYYAADGNAGETSASAGDIWRVHFAPDEIGAWNYAASFRTGTNVAVNASATAGTATSFDGANGSFNVVASDKTGRDHRGKGRLQYDGTRYLKHAETGEPYLKTGADAPENFLNYLEFDNTYNHGGTDYRKSWAPHIQDWASGDPAWQNGKGKGIIGAINYLASEGQNVFSFLTYNAGGDSKDVWPYVSHSNPLRFDCSKLDQWEIVFTHGDIMGMYLHFKTQETENDDLSGPGASYALDSGNVGTERKLYYRELIARFGHHMALNWNLGEETTQTTTQHQQMAQYFYDNDPYGHNIVIHTYPNQQEQRYRPLLGNNSKLTGASVQTRFSNVHAHTLQWLTESANAGRQWVVANDEQGPADKANPPDSVTNNTPSQREMRWQTVWGNFMAGGAGIELYAGYQNPHSDLTLDDFRSRNRMWDYCRHAHTFFTNYLPFTEMVNSNGLIGNGSNSNSKYCFAKTDEVYAIYLPNGGTTNLNLSAANGNFTVRWFNPRDGGVLQVGTVDTVSGGGSVSIGNAPSQTGEDWAVLVSKSGPDPDVNIIAPNNGLEITVGTSVTFRAAISDNPNFDRVEFYLNGELVDIKHSPPYEVSLTGLALGVHNLSVIEYDSSDNTSMDSIGIGVVEASSGGLTEYDFNAFEDVFIQNTTVFNTNELRVENGSRVSYLKFTVSGIPENDTIQSATLSIQQYQPGLDSGGQGTLRFYTSANTSWSEATITNANKPTKGSLIGTRSGAVTQGQRIDVDVTPLVTGNGTYTVIIEMDSGGNDIWFGSSESGGSAPQLTVEAGEEILAPMALNRSMVTDVMILTWWPTDGILETTQDLGADNWQPVSGSASPFHAEFVDTHRFYRVRED